MSERLRWPVPCPVDGEPLRSAGWAAGPGVRAVYVHEDGTRHLSLRPSRRSAVEVTALVVAFVASLLWSVAWTALGSGITWAVEHLPTRHRKRDVTILEASIECARWHE